MLLMLFGRKDAQPGMHVHVTRDCYVGVSAKETTVVPDTPVCESRLVLGARSRVVLL